jgi:phosphoribosylaminoimidazole carboxylase PurE protein
MASTHVMILMGSDSDLDPMSEACKELERFGIGFEIHVSSAHRSPEKTRKLVEGAEARGIKVFICGAGASAHLAGVVAAHTALPVIGVPMHGHALSGADALYSTVQMPQGIPVATVAIGRGGAGNAGILAAQILALADPELTAKLKAFKKGLADKVEKKDAELQAKGYVKYLEGMK